MLKHSSIGACNPLLGLTASCYHTDYPVKTAKNKRVILVYNTMFDAALDYSVKDIPQDYLITIDRSLFNHACAVVFHVPSLDLVEFEQLAGSKRAGQLWVMWSMESVANFPIMLNPRFTRHFDMTMTYRLDSDVPVTYSAVGMERNLRKQPYAKEPENVVSLFVSSHSNQSGRRQYLSELSQHIEIHSYGKFLQNRRLKNDSGWRGKLMALQHYKFNLAFENSIEHDYVTEKFYDPLVAGCVPVYLGAPTVDRFAPGENSYVDVSDWARPKELAEYLTMLANDGEQYQRFFEWKSKPFRQSYLALMESIREHSFVRLCRVVEQKLAN